MYKVLATFPYNENLGNEIIDAIPSDLFIKGAEHRSTNLATVQYSQIVVDVDPKKEKYISGFIAGYLKAKGV